jgi:predicted acylesterase/phospholipase RssA
MILVSIMAPNERFVTAQPGGELLANVSAPVPASEFLVSVIDRPEAESILPGDRLVIRSVSSFNVWEYDLRRPASIHARSALVPSTAIRVRYVDEARISDVRRGIACILGAETIISGTIVGSAPPFPTPAGGVEYGGFELGTDTEGRLVRSGGTFRDEDPPLSPRGMLDTGVPAARRFGLLPHSIRAHLKAIDGRFVRFAENEMQLSPSAAPGALEEFTLVNANRPFARRLFHGDFVYLRERSGARPLRVSTEASRDGVLAGSESGPTIFRLERLRGEGELFEDEFRLHLVDSTAGSAETRRLAIAPSPRVPGLQVLRAVAEAANRSDVFRLSLFKELRLFHHSGRRDHASTTDTELGSGYALRGVQARVRMSPGIGQVPLRSYLREGRGDLLTTATESGGEIARDERYRFRRVEGYVSQEPERHAAPAKMYRHPSHGDFLLAVKREEEELAAREGYRFSWVDSYVAPDNQTRPSTTVPNTGTIGTLPGGIRLGAGSISVGTGIRLDPRRLPTIPGAIRRPERRALVLSGGGAKGAFEVGAVKRLWETGYRPDLICGVSVGAVNASKLAEGTDEALRQLERLWLDSSAQRGALYHREHYLKLLGKLTERVLSRTGDSALAAFFGGIFGAAMGPLMGPLGTAMTMGTGNGLPLLTHFASPTMAMGMGNTAGALLGFLIGAQGQDLDGATLRLINVILTLVHSRHSMSPLRRTIASQLNLAALRGPSAISLRMGITDIKGGRFFNVSGPQPDSPAALADYGLVEVEPDHTLGPTWLERPLYGADRYAMRVQDAVYASSALPAFMEPVMLDLRQCEVVPMGGERIARLPSGEQTPLAPGLERLASVTQGSSLAEPFDGLNLEHVERAIDEILALLPEANRETLLKVQRLATDRTRGVNGALRFLFDGGLRDTMPLRTALRLGATDITVISVDRLQSYEFPYAQPLRLNAQNAGDMVSLLLNLSSTFSGVDLSSMPLFQHMLGLIGIWYNEVARTDLLLGVARNEFLRWMRRAAEQLDEPRRRAFLDDLHRYWEERGSEMFDALGASAWLGGAPGDGSYGKPGVAPGARIRLIAPDRDLLDALSFDDHNGVRDAIELGERAARTPRTLSE